MSKEYSTSSASARRPTALDMAVLTIPRAMMTIAIIAYTTINDDVSIAHTLPKLRKNMHPRRSCVWSSPQRLMSIFARKP